MNYNTPKPTWLGTERNFIKTAIGFYSFIIVCVTAFWVTVGIVAWHFIHKLW
jgi:hypothetical protein